MTAKISLDEIIKRCVDKHDDAFDYTNFNVIKMSDKSTIKHNVCGNTFEKSAKQLLSKQTKPGKGCPYCAYKIKTKDYFLKSCKEVHDNKYDYSKFVYENYSTKGIIICNTCGHNFSQHPTGHVTYKYGCPNCAGKLRDLDQFIEKATKVHYNLYDYTKTVYTHSETKVIITCKEHGDFLQTPKEHISGRGCRKCKYEYHLKSQTLTEYEYVTLANDIHNNKYTYKFETYKNNKTPITIICPEHGEFNQIAGNHLNLGHGCPKCNSNISKKETEVRDFISTIYNGEIITNSKKIINGYELDIYLPDINFAIEYNGLYWHSEKHILDKNYHLKKTKECESKGIHLFHLFEDDWILKNEIVKSMLINNISKSKNIIYARKCLIKDVNYDDAKIFLDNNHLQGYSSSKIKLGLYYNDKLVSLMTFGNYRICLGKKAIEDHYELIRFCNKINHTVVGGSSKLFKSFIKKYKPKQILSYADYSWSKGNMYNKLGFTLVSTSRPNYHYIIGNKKHHRYKYRKSELIKQGFDKNKSEHQIMYERKIYRIYDCGTLKFEWVNKKRQ